MSERELAPWQEWVLERFREHGQRLDVHLHIDGPINFHVSGASNSNALQQILTNLQELKTMSQTVQQTIDANNVRMSAAIDGITTDIAAIQAELAAAIPPAGTVVSQASADAMTAVADKLDAVKTSLDGLVQPTAPVVP